MTGPSSSPHFAFLIPHPYTQTHKHTHTHTHTVLLGGDQKPGSEAPHLGMFAEEAGPGRAALHAPVDWLHQVWPAVLLAWPRAVGAVQLGKACFPKEEKKRTGEGGGRAGGHGEEKKKAKKGFRLF